MSVVVQQPLVRTIACWVQGQYAAWMVEQDDADALLETTLESLLQRLGDHTKKVQEAACSALVKVMREYEDKLEHYCHPIAHGLMQAYGVYQVRTAMRCRNHPHTGTTCATTWRCACLARAPLKRLCSLTGSA